MTEFTGPQTSYVMRGKPSRENVSPGSQTYAGLEIMTLVGVRLLEDFGLAAEWMRSCMITLLSCGKYIRPNWCPSLDLARRRGRMLHPKCQGVSSPRPCSSANATSMPRFSDTLCASSRSLRGHPKTFIFFFLPSLTTSFFAPF